MRHVLPFVLALCCFSGLASAQEPSVPEEPQVLGSGPIADQCRLLFADPVAQTACEVHITLDQRSQERIEKLETTNEMLFAILDELDSAETRLRISFLEQLHMSRSLHRLGVNGEFGPVGNQDMPLLNSEGSPIVSEPPVESGMSVCQSFDLDMSGVTFPHADGHMLSPVEGHTYLMDIDGARHEIQCLMKPRCKPAPIAESGDEICVDYTKCCDAGVK